MRRIGYNPALKKMICSNCRFSAARYDAANLDYPNSTVCTVVAALGEFEVDKDATCDSYGQFLLGRRCSGSILSFIPLRSFCSRCFRGWRGSPTWG
jgi:protein-arginine kinase activator protein McsA